MSTLTPAFLVTINDSARTGVVELEVEALNNIDALRVAIDRYEDEYEVSDNMAEVEVVPLTVAPPSAAVERCAICDTLIPTGYTVCSTEHMREYNESQDEPDSRLTRGDVVPKGDTWVAAYAPDGGGYRAALIDKASFTTSMDKFNALRWDERLYPTASSAKRRAEALS